MSDPLAQSPEDLMLRAVQALEGIQDQLVRIRVAEGPCGQTKLIRGTDSFWHEGKRIEQPWSMTAECNLAAGHTGMHSDHGPFRDTTFNTLDPEQRWADE